MRLAICDDEKIFREYLIREIRAILGGLEVSCQSFSRGDALLREIRGGASFDGIFLDIEMEGFDGLTTAREIRKADREVSILFLTSHTELAMDGYEVAAFRFLGKPVERAKLEKALFDVRDRIQRETGIMVRQDGEAYAVALEHILYVSAENNNVRFVCTDREYIMRRKLTDVYRELCGLSENFCQVHRGILVNLKHVKKYTATEIFLDCKKIVPLSRGCAKEFREQMLAYVRRTAR